MINLRSETTDVPARRSFFGRLAGATALGLAGLLPAVSSAQAEPAKNDGPNWPGS